jgi:hypothetical protein
MKPSRTSPQIDASATPSSIFAAESSEDQTIDELSRKMLSWSGLWFGSSDNCQPTENQSLVRKRLLSWLERCIGLKARAVLSDRAEDVSLATSTPLLTAFLGRRAMVELSRRVLSDL